MSYSPAFRRNGCGLVIRGWLYAVARGLLLQGVIAPFRRGMALTVGYLLSMNILWEKHMDRFSLKPV